MNPSGQDDGLTNACDRLKQASQLSGDLNGKTAALCTNNQYACSNTCQSLISKYQNLADNCGDGCDNYSTYQDAISSLQTAQSTCMALAPNANALSVASLSSGSDQGVAAACGVQAGSSPSDQGGGYSPSAMRTASAESSGYALPNQQTAMNYQPATDATGAVTYAAAKAGTAGYNLTETPSGVNYGNAYGAPTPGPQVNPIPSNGGGFPALADGAKLNDARGNSPGSPGFPTDVDQGFRSGGYSAPGGPGPTDNANARGLIGGGRKLASEFLSGFEGMDLKQYLPGGSKYRVGGAAAARAEINGKEEDIFRRITIKYVEKCKLGELWQCQD